MIYFMFIFSVIFSQLPKDYYLEKNTRLDRFENISYKNLNSKNISQN